MKLLFFVLMLKMCCCFDFFLEQKNIRLGRNVRLECPLQDRGSRYWVRIKPGSSPSYKVLSGTRDVHPDDHRYLVKKEHNNFIMEIEKTTINDTSVYLCFKVADGMIIFLKGFDLKVEEPRASPTRRPVTPERPSTVQCSLRNAAPENECQPEDSLLSDPSNINESDTSLNHSQRNAEDRDHLSVRKYATCHFQLFSSSSSDAPNCSCVTCGHVPLGNRSRSSCQGGVLYLYLLSGALTLILVVTAALICTIVKLKRIMNNHRKGALEQQTIVRDDETEQTDENNLLYSTVFFTRKKDSSPVPGNVSPADETIDNYVRTVAQD